MIKEIKYAFEANLPDVKWMDADTKAKAIEKVSGLYRFCFTN